MISSWTPRPLPGRVSEGLAVSRRPAGRKEFPCPRYRPYCFSVQVAADILVSIGLSSAASRRDIIEQNIAHLLTAIGLHWRSNIHREHNYKQTPRGLVCPSLEPSSRSPSTTIKNLMSTSSQGASGPSGNTGLLSGVAQPVSWIT